MVTKTGSSLSGWNKNWRILGPNRNENIGKWEKHHNERFHIYT
jgi:hypothetical protein